MKVWIGVSSRWFPDFPPEKNQSHWLIWIHKSGFKNKQNFYIGSPLNERELTERMMESMHNDAH